MTSGRFPRVGDTDSGYSSQIITSTVYLTYNRMINENRHSRLKPFRDEGRTYRLRQWINVAFLLISIIGVAVYYAGHHVTGLYIVGAACVLKFIELTLRLMKM
jgi:hypothetical protein